MKDPREAVAAAAADRTSGAAEIAAVAARALAQLPTDEVRGAIEGLLAGHPSMAPLWRLATDMLSAPAPGVGASRFLERLASDAAAPRVLIPHLHQVTLTISYSSSVLEAVRLAGRSTRWICMASEPGGEGRRMAQAAAAWTEATVLQDDEAIRTVPAEAVVVGADAITPEGVVNKVKTRGLVEAARAKGISCHAVAGETKFIAVRLPVEPAFEPTPLELLTGVASAFGLLGPAEARQTASESLIHPDLQPLLDQLPEPDPDLPR